MIDQLGLDAWQPVLLGIAAVVLITMFISEEKKKIKKDTVNEDTLVTVPLLGPTGDDHSIQIVIPHAEPNKDIVRIVCAWSSFKRECVKSGLTEAVDKVDAIFPLLINLNGGDHVEQ